MMTVHGAKGLEFHYVFIAGLGRTDFWVAIDMNILLII